MIHVKRHIELFSHRAIARFASSRLSRSRAAVFRRMRIGQCCIVQLAGRLLSCPPPPLVLDVQRGAIRFKNGVHLLPVVRFHFAQADDLPHDFRIIAA